MAFCYNCGASLSDDACFCTFCGTKQIPSPDKELSVETPKEKGEFDGVIWDTPGSSPAQTRPAQVQPAPSRSAQPLPKADVPAAKRPKKKKGVLFWVLTILGVLLVAFLLLVLYAYFTVVK